MANKRQWDPRGWPYSSRLLVFGELLAFCSAAVGAVLWMVGVDVPWLFVSAAVVSTFCLTWYAVDLVTQGEWPLTHRRVKMIKSIADAVRTEDRFRIRIDWDRWTVQEDGSVSFEFDQADAIAKVVLPILQGEHGPRAQELVQRLLDDAASGSAHND